MTGPTRPHDAPANPRTDSQPPRAHRDRPPRIELSVEVGIDDYLQYVIGFCENVSTTGLFVATYHPLPVGTEVALVLTLPGAAPLFVHGQVRWVRERESPGMVPGVGVQFTDLNETARRQLCSYVEALTLGQPEIER